MKMYCLRCKAHKEIENPIADVTKNFTPIARAICPDCGCKIVKIVGGPPFGWGDKMREAKRREEENETGT